LKKKVLHIVESFGGGVFSFLVDLVNNTSDEYDVVIAYGMRKETPENFQKYFNNNVKFIEIKTFTRKIDFKKDLASFFEIKKIQKREKADIIHLHSSKAGFLGRFAINGRKVKMLYNAHGFSFLMQDNSKIKRTIYWLIEKIATIRKCIIVACSQGEYEEALKLTKNSICINNNIDIDRLQKKTSSFREKEIDFKCLKFCTIGRIENQKNPQLFNKIAEAFPNYNFTWIGDGNLKNVLTSKNIVCTGWKTHDEVLKKVNENDIFILTSLWEGLPLSLLEAMYLKKICIVTDCIGNRDVIKDGENGFIFESNNIQNAIEKINRAIENKNIKKIKENSFQDVKDNYSIKMMINKYKELYVN